MKYLIAFKSHHGTTRKMVEHMTGVFGKENVTLFEPGRSVVPDVDLFDVVIIGGSIHGGKIQKEIKTFCLVNKDKLLKKRLGLFLCFMLKEKGTEEFNSAFPAELRAHATATGLLGGELLIDKMNFFERLMTRVVSGKKANVSQLENQALNDFENKMMYI